VNKNSISCILALLILFESIGCYATKSLKPEETQDLTEGDKINVRMHDGTVHSFTFEKIDDDKIYGIKKMIRYYKSEETQVIIKRDEIESIELIELNKRTTYYAIAAGLFGTGLIVFLLVLNPPSYPWSN